MAGVRESVRRKLMAVVLFTTFIALLIASAAMTLYDFRSYRNAAANDLLTQARILGHAAAPALAFDDEKAAEAALATLSARSSILAAAIYRRDGQLFARYVQSGAPLTPFPRVSSDGVEFDGNRVTVFFSLVEDNELQGTIYLLASYDFHLRLQDYISIMVAVMAMSLLAALLISLWLQRALTRPLLSVAEIAEQVVERRDFSLRATKTTDDEIGTLVEAFNAMLAEVERRAGALEDSNRTLQREMLERHAAEDALRVADRRKDEFLATLAHELRNPLAPLQNALHILRLKENDRAAAEKARAMMERQLRQLVRLVDDLLDVSRITTGKLAVRREPVELQAVLRSAVETARPFVDARKHKLEIDIPDNPSIVVKGDATRLAQVFSNLLNNAAKYTDEGGTIGLRCAVEDDRAIVKVSDNGIGIPEGMLSSIFDMFTQADSSLERAYSGLGVGLTLARSLVELHGGRISVSSAGLRQGSEFQVSLPILSVSALPAPARDAPAPSHGHVHRILLADDNVDFALSMSELLRQAGHEVRVEHDGRAAFAAALEFHPDTAFLDIGLPGLNGYDLAARMRGTPELAHCVLIAVTGWGQERDRVRAREAGFDRHLVKPADLAQIMAILDNACPLPGT